MRQYRNILLFALIFAGLASCQSDEDGTDNGQEIFLDTTGLLLDGGRISRSAFIVWRKTGQVLAASTGKIIMQRRRRSRIILIYNLMSKYTETVQGTSRPIQR